ncbi:unnamed protein product [Cyclocybe aegerita]|uniref:Uncharacterized protein n=1 Tax=Cyclocybe aegerita TaxID=1973307 RepID=A0A8S0X4U7_CYCAE|nr:unnamed protein product [Cyclocybe aegerita]
MRSWAICLPFWALLFGRIALALPGTTRHALVNRSEQDFFTMYGANYDLAPPDGERHLANIKDVFMVMTRSLNAELSAMTADPAAAPTPAPNADPFMVTAPPYMGPGPELLPTASPSPTRVSDDELLSSSHTPAPSHKMVVLGSVIGSILFFALCIFFLFNPAFSGRFCRGSGARKCIPSSHRPIAGPLPSEEVKEVKDDPSTPPGLPPSPSWVTVGFHKQGARSTVHQDDAAIDDTESVGDTIIEMPVDSSPAKSKFSVCSSEYLSLSSMSHVNVNRDSHLTDDSGTSTIKPDCPPAPAPTPSSPTPPYASPSPSPNSSPSRKPVRPPRPPTADSPALSDSVYLACSDQPYVIVAPQPLTDADLQPGPTGTSAPAVPNRIAPKKKMLTPSEFFALHVPAALAALGVGNGRPFGSGGGSKTVTGDDETTTRPLSEAADSAAEREREDERGSRTSQRHSRTKSAPALGRAGKLKGRKAKLGSRRASAENLGLITDQEEGGEDIDADPIARRVMQHRRSRSASGWAYPARAQSRRSFNDDSEV